MKLKSVSGTARRTTTLLVAAAAVCVAPANAQNSDALLRKLVDKGILTTKEADELKQDAAKDDGRRVIHGVNMPDWVTSLKFYGDFRGRYEKFYSENDAFTSRDRYRYRVRLGTTVTIKDDFEIGLRLTSADPTTGGSGNPLSGSSTFQDNGSKKFIYIDLVYGKWTPVHNGTWSASATIGKMNNPFEVSNMVFDYDYTPEGAGLQIAYKLNEQHTFKANGGVFVLDEIGQGAGAGHDPITAGAQLLWEAKWTPEIETAVGISAFGLSSTDNLGNGAVPNVNGGNTRDATGAPMFAFNPIVGSASATYKLASFPFFPGEFPIKVVGEYMENPAAPSQNRGYLAGVIFGKAAKKGTWDVSYRYERLEADAWYEELVDEDNGAFYQTSKANSGFAGNGYRGGTNVKGHLVKLNYALTDAVTFSFIFYVNDLVHPSPAGSESTAGHVMADLNWKF